LSGATAGFITLFKNNPHINKACIESFNVLPVLRGDIQQK